MADNKNVKDSAGTDFALALLDISSVFYPKNVLYNSVGAALAKAIDAVAGASDYGIPPLAIRDDALTTLTPVDGDWSTLRLDSVGALWTRDVGFKAEDAVHASGDTGIMMLGVRQDTQAAFAADGDYVPASFDSSGNLRVAISSSQVASILDCSTTVTRPADTSDYASGDAFANSTSAPTAGGFTFTNAAAVSGGGGTITDVVIVASDAKLYVGEIWVFEAAATAVNDNAAFACSDADHLLLLGKIPFQLAADVSTTSWAHITGLNMGYHCVGSANLRFLIRLTGAIVAPGSAATLTVRIKGIRS
jgi:hypothetical protein